MTSRKQYAALCCYFGQWPTHFGHWLSSCSYNERIDFFLVSDIASDGYEVPANVHIVNRSFAQVCDLVRQKFPTLHISLDRCYKLCDFKTAYGYIFEDLFADYDYWGYCDIDTIWGDIVKFIPDNEDSHLVKIFPCGHLSFIRNLSPWNKAYELVNQVAGTPCRNNMAGKQVVTWQECFSSPESHYYDEEGGLEPMFDAIVKVEENYSDVDFDNILPPWRFDHFQCINYPEKSINLVYSFEGGRLYRHYLQGIFSRKEEISYLHISRREMEICTTDTTRFVIYPNRIAEWRQWNPFTLLIYGRPRRLYKLMGRMQEFIDRFCICQKCRIIHFLSCAKSRRRPCKETTQILNITYSDKYYIDKQGFLPIAAGGGRDDVMGDNIGDNISDRNNVYGELTSVYWAWKNLKGVGIIGMSHYRRCLMPYGSRWLTKCFYELNRQIFKEIDYSISGFEQDLRVVDFVIGKKWHFEGLTIREQFLQHHPFPEDLVLVRDVLAHLHPESVDMFDSFLEGSDAYCCCLFITRWELFDHLCNWMFPVLFEIEKRLDNSKYDKYQGRVIAFLYERLLNIYLELYKYKIKEYPFYMLVDGSPKSIIRQDLGAKVWNVIRRFR